MATFTVFNDRLPDPTFGVSLAGSADGTGQLGPGFASVSISSNRPVQSSRTISGRGIQVSNGAHNWDININYHPMTRDSFDIVSSFLDARNGKLNPFYVVLPQYSRPKDPAFSVFAQANTISVAGAHAAGSSVLMIDAPGAFSGTARPGDYFTIFDGADTNHRKTYKVTRVETNALYQSGKSQPAVNQLRLHIMPPLVRNTSDNAVVNFIDPRFRVIQKGDVLEYNLNTDNLYQFQLQLEEIHI